MAKKIFKNKKLWKNIGIGAVAGVLGIGAIMGVGALLNKEDDTTKTINPTYAVGGLTEQGQYLETKGSIYTKEAFECQGIDVSLAFDNNVSYRIFFYDEDNDFISATSKQTGNYDETTTPALSHYARIVITPNDDEEISFFEKNSYAKQLTIEVNKDQKYQVQERVINFTINDFAQKNFTENWLFESATNTLTTRYVLNKYVAVNGTDVVVHCDSPNYSFKVAVFDGQPSTDNLINGSGFYTPDTTGLHIDVSNFIVNEDSTYYLAVGFEKVDKSDFTTDDIKELAKSFYITYNA